MISVLNTIQRADNLRRLITALANEMMRDDIAELLGMSQSGGRKYIRALGPLIEEVRRVDVTAQSTGQPVYRLTSDACAAQAFLATLETNVMPAGTRKNRVRPVDATRHVHICPDDEAFVPKMHRGLPMAYPMALPREFFEVRA